MDTARIAALLEPFLEQSLPQSQLDQISIYIDLLLRWNARINLTAIRSEEEIVTRHFGESFFLARHLFPAISNSCHPERSQDMRFAHFLAELEETPTPSPRRRSESSPAPCARPHVLDIGSGAGFPALPLKLWAPQINLTLIESNHKKAAFLREVARALTLTNINVLTGRAQALGPEPQLPGRRSNPPGGRAPGNHPPSSPNLPGPKRNPSPTNNHPPDPPIVDPDQPEMACQMACPKVTFKGVTTRVQSVEQQIHVCIACQSGPYSQKYSHN